jgi:hypothetical protein
LVLQKKLLLTFDYELFLGKRSGSVEKCMLQPTNKLISVLQEYKARGIFFVDTTYLIRLSEVSLKYPRAKKDFELITAQIKTLMEQSHYVYPHIHPHWLDAVYLDEQNEWELSDLRRYRFHSISVQERDMLFERSTAILTTIAGDHAYNADAYRAGGWCIQPFSDFISNFDRYGIKTDFSVLPGFRNPSELMYYDFTAAPNASVYRFSEDVLQVDESGPYTQFAISRLTFSKWNQWRNRILLKYLWKTGKRSIGDGISASDPSAEKNKIQNGEMASIELLTSVKLDSYLHYFNTHDYMQFISHPKMLSVHNLEVFGRFMNEAFAKGDVETDYKKMKVQ